METGHTLNQPSQEEGDDQPTEVSTEASQLTTSRGGSVASSQGTPPAVATPWVLPDPTQPPPVPSPPVPSPGRDYGGT